MRTAKKATAISKKSRAASKSAKKPAKAAKKRAGVRRPKPGHIIIKKSDDKCAHWYVVHTYSGHEAKVAEQLRQRVISMGLEDKILEILTPTQDKIQIRSGKKETIKEKIFPGYLLVRMVFTDQSWLTVRTTAGITGFVGIGSKPTPLETEEVKAIQKFAKLKAPKFKARFNLGEAVKIIDGPFAEFLGTVDQIDEDKGKVRVLVSIFGRETPVELDFLQVSKI